MTRGLENTKRKANSLVTHFSQCSVLSILTEYILDFEKRDVRITSEETNCSPRQGIDMCLKQCDSLRDNCSQPVNPATLTKRA